MRAVLKPAPSAPACHPPSPPAPADQPLAQLLRDGRRDDAHGRRLGGIGIP
jgi:hypothetical protein